MRVVDESAVAALAAYVTTVPVPWRDLPALGTAPPLWPETNVLPLRLATAEESASHVAAFERRVDAYQERLRRGREAEERRINHQRARAEEQRLAVAEHRELLAFEADLLAADLARVDMPRLVRAAYRLVMDSTAYASAVEMDDDDADAAELCREIRHALGISGEPQDPYLPHGSDERSR